MKATATAVVALLVAAVRCSLLLPLKIRTRTRLNSPASNIHVHYLEPVREIVSFTYGACESSTHAHDFHHLISQTTSQSHDRLVWILPENVHSGGCISAWGNSTGRLLGRSEKQYIDLQTMEHRRNIKLRRQLAKRKHDLHNIHMDSSTGVDVWGAWFDGVELLNNTEIAPIDAVAAKSKRVAIVGGGMAGLMSYLLLTQQGMTNVSIIEAGNRLGGRVQTVYLSGGPFDYSYQEMGPMRFPTTLTVSNETYNITDHQLVFQLANEMNRINGYDKSLSVDFIPWYDFSDIDKDWYPSDRSSRMSSLEQAKTLIKARSVPDPSMKKLFNEVHKTLPCRDVCVEMAKNMFRAHREWLTIHFSSEYAYMVNYLTARPNITDPQSVTKFVSSFWDRSHGSDTGRSVNSTHDYVMIAVPFSAMKNWSISGLSRTMQDAITHLPYTSACKVALEYETRFWEHLDEPIYGSCRPADPERFPGIGNICYPSYNINGTGRGALLASYIAQPGWSDKWASASEREHVHVARRQYTGKFSRVCGVLDPLEGASWADPTLGQHQRYLPEYFKTHNNMIFVGEHTSYTHAWIASALESAIRGSVQLLLGK
ncbi:L-amino acid oxidase [Podospora didyma]|uniref:L-amino acid oxidase n=1 Tax=Podospora didyma TaxID=330526 RepID=A0AAE0K5M7_9PEZI|nr:L-amino acid oxidase [Podospora didyma]